MRREKVGFPHAFQALYGALFISLAMVLPVEAEEKDPDGPSKNAFSVEGVMRLNAGVKRDGSGDYQDSLRLKESEILLEGQLREKVQAFVKLKLDQDLRLNGQRNRKFGQYDVENLIKSAGIKLGISDWGELTLGKHEVAYGQNYEGMVVFNENPLDEINHFNKVIGLTFKVEPSFFEGLALEVSGFETQAGDLSIGPFNGVSARVTQKLTDQFKLSLSGMHRGNGYEGHEDPDDYGSVGLIYESRDGKYVAWGEVLGFANSAEYPESRWGTSLGALRNIGPGQVIIEATAVDQALRQVGVGAKLHLTERTSIGAELRYTDY